MNASQSPYHVLPMALAAAFLTAASVAGQAVINIPPDNSPVTVGANTVVNVLPGGLLQAHDSVVASNGAVINVLGGRVDVLSLESGAIANVMSGGVHGRFWVIDGGRLSHEGGRTNSIHIAVAGFGDVRGGAIESLGASNDSMLTLHGVDFAINGVPVAGLDQEGDAVSVDLPLGTILSGTLADGTPFARAQIGLSDIDNGVLTLRRSAEPTPVAPGTITINTESSLPFVRSGQTAVVQSGGRLQEQFRAGAGSRVELNGGFIESAFHAIGAELVINSGHVARRLNAFDDSVVTLHGGALEGDARFYRGSRLNIEGGEVGSGIWIREGATLKITGGETFEVFGFTGSDINIDGGIVHNVGTEGRLVISGGSIVGGFGANTASGVVEISGGRHADSMSVRADARLIVRGSEIRINGTPAQGLGQPGTSINVPLGPNVVLSGIYADGTPFAIGGDQEQVHTAVQIIETPAPAPGPALIEIPTDPVPAGVRSGQTLVLKDGGVLPANFSSAFGSTVRIEGGVVGQNFEAVGTKLDMTGGQAAVIDAFSGTMANIAGDAQWDQLNVYAGSVATIDSAVEHAGGFRAFPGSTVNVKDIQLNSVFQAERAIINISGGSIGHYQLDSLVGGNSALTVTGGFLEGVAVTDHSTAHVTGGRVGYLQVTSETQARIDGGQVDWLGVHTEAVADVHAGIVGDTDNQRGTIRIHGGALGDSHEWLEGTVELRGYDFQVDGMPVAGLDAVGNTVPLDYTEGTTITGTLSDGTPFNLAQRDNFQSMFISNNVLRLVRTAVPTLPATIQVPSDPAPFGISAGQTVIVTDGGVLGEHFLAGRDSNVEIRGGEVGNNFEAERSEVMITGGTIGNRMDVFRGAEVIVRGGSIGDEWEVHPGGVLDVEGGQLGRLGTALGSIVNVRGGMVGSEFTVLQGATLNVTGGLVGSGLLAESGATVNVMGGAVDRSLRAWGGAEVNISGGQVREIRTTVNSNVNISGGNIDGLDAALGAQVRITGGSFSDDLRVDQASDTALSGVDFALDGMPIVGLDTPGNQVQFTLAVNQLLSGTLADGTPFAFRTNEGDSIGSIRLTRSADIPPGPAMINVPTDAAPGGVRAGQQLTLLAGGALPANFNAGKGSAVYIQGGTVGSNFEAVGAVVNVLGGEVGNDMDALPGSEINVMGGKIGNNLDAYNDSKVNIRGGSIALIDALNGSQVNMEGGQITRLQASNGSHTRWTGGVMGSVNVTGATSTFTVHGVGFKINGIPIAGLDDDGDSLQFNMPASSILTGTLADGTPIALSNGLNFPGSNASFANGTLALVRSPQPAPGPAFIHVVDTNAPFAVGADQTLLVEGQGALPNDFTAGEGSIVQVRGGSVGANFRSFDSEVHIAAGSIGTNFVALPGTDLVITGGQFRDFALLGGAHAQIHGGMLPGPLRIEAGAVVDIFGKSFLLNNQPIPGLSAPGSAVILNQRGGQVLSAILPDGSQLQWNLTASGGRGNPFGISSDAILRVRLVPEPATVLVALVAAMWMVLQYRRLAR